MFDRKTGAWACAAIKKVAQGRNFYDPDTERDLAAMEGAANQVLKELRLGQLPSPSRRGWFALYISTMLMRVPRRRRTASELVPSVLERTISGVRRDLTNLAVQTGQDELLSKRLSELDEIHARYRNELPESISEQIRSPWPTNRILAAVSEMTWRVVRSSGPSWFLTTDNPAFYFEGAGIGTEHSELTFPIASDLAVVGNRQGEPGAMLFVNGTQHLVKEINRRLVSGAERFVFCHQREHWLAEMAKRQTLDLNRIVW
jgi:hypothetical protein